MFLECFCSTVRQAITLQSRARLLAESVVKSRDRETTCTYRASAGDVGSSGCDASARPLAESDHPVSHSVRQWVGVYISLDDDAAAARWFSGSTSSSSRHVPPSKSQPVVSERRRLDTGDKAAVTPHRCSTGARSCELRAYKHLNSFRQQLETVFISNNILLT